MINSKRKTKNGFSLIELIIVLAVMAIIALIAIPNFTAVRENSKNKADQQSMKIIERVISIVKTEVEIVNDVCFDIRFDSNDKLSLSWGVTDLIPEQKNYFEESFSGVKKPQGISTIYTPGKRANAYRVDIYRDGRITVNTYDTKTNGVTS